MGLRRRKGGCGDPPPDPPSPNPKRPSLAGRGCCHLPSITPRLPRGAAKPALSSTQMCSGGDTQPGTASGHQTHRVV